MRPNYVLSWLCLIGGLLILTSCKLPARPTPGNVRATEMAQTRITQTLQAVESTGNPGAINVTDTPTPNSPTITPTSQFSKPEATSTLTPEPQLSQTEPNTADAQPTLTALPNIRPTPTPTPTPTLLIPDAAIQIREPGPFSRISSPLRLVGWAKPGGDGRVRMELFGEDGRLLVRKVLLFGTDDRRYFLNETLNFEIPGVAETARLVISTYDSFGRQNSLASQDLILLSIGESQINPPGRLDEPVVILEPRPNKLIQGGTALISGQALPFNEQLLLVELIARDGRVVGYRQAFVPPSPDGKYMPFLAEIPYQVEAVTSARLTIKAYSSGRIPGIIYITSQEILLSP